MARPEILNGNYGVYTADIDRTPPDFLVKSRELGRKAEVIVRGNGPFCVYSRIEVNGFNGGIQKRASVGQTLEDALSGLESWIGPLVIEQMLKEFIETTEQIPRE